MTEPLLDRNLRLLLETAGLPAADDRVDAACGRFLARLQPPRRRWLRLLPAAAALLFFALVLRSVLTPAPDAGPAQAADAAAVDRSVKELDDPSPDVRQAAERRLLELAGDAEYLLYAAGRAGADALTERIRKTLGASLEHDGHAFGEAFVRELAGARPAAVFDVADLVWGPKGLPGEDLAASVVGRSGLSAEAAKIQFNDGLLVVHGAPAVAASARDVLHELRAEARARRSARPPIDRLLAPLTAPNERSLWERAEAFRHALTTLDRRSQAPPAEGAARAGLLAERFREGVLRMSRHDFHRRAAIERIRAEWGRTAAEQQGDLIRRAFAPCHVRTCEVEAGAPEQAKALQENDGIVYLLGGHAVGATFQLPPPGLTLVFTVPGGAVNVAFDD